jgi:hypothetical protein
MWFCYQLPKKYWQLKQAHLFIWPACLISMPVLFVPTTSALVMFVFLVKRVPGRGPELREPNKAVLCLLIIIISISYYYILLLNYYLWRTIPAETGNGTLYGFVYFLGWVHACNVSFPLCDTIFPQLACPLNDVILCLPWE